MSPAAIAQLLIGVALIAYALTAGADFGAGAWDLLASGPRAARQRALIAHAIGPIWEANHVWLIFILVVLFNAFPRAFSTIFIALHLPLALLLVGIILRGAAFSFRSYGLLPSAQQERWGRIFSLSSLLTPLSLGVILGALASGQIRLQNGRMVAGFFAWMGLFPLACGLLAVALFGFLAAVFLATEAADQEETALASDFRARALAVGLLLGPLSLTVYRTAQLGAPRLAQALTGQWWSWPLQGLTAAAAVGALWTLWTRRYRQARIAAAAQATLLIGGWALGMGPYLVVPDLTRHNAAAPTAQLSASLVAIGVGAVFLVPALVWLMWLFKRRPRS